MVQMSSLRTYLQVCEFLPMRLHFIKVCLPVLPWVENKSSPYGLRGTLMIQIIVEG